MSKRLMILCIGGCILALVLAAVFLLSDKSPEPQASTTLPAPEETEIAPESTRQTQPTQAATLPPVEQTDAPTQPPTAPDLPAQTELPDETAAPDETTAPADTTSQTELEYGPYGQYTGAYVEDGSDAPVENVAAILITNPTDEFLEYAQLTFDMNGTVATFVVTGLPAGASAWVLESNRLILPEGGSLTLQDEVTSFSSGGNVTSGLSYALGSGTLSIENTGSETYHNLYVYYRQLHTDGNYLGGITYRVSFGDVSPGAAVTNTAGHCTPDHCQIVKITKE